MGLFAGVASEKLRGKCDEEKASSTQLVSIPMSAESVNSELSSTLPGTAFMQTM
jgi:hypothetical protein